MDTNSNVAPLAAPAGAPEPDSLITALAKGYCEHSTLMDLHGKRRDDGVVDYYRGAIAALQFAGDSKGALEVLTILSTVYTSRGYEAVCKSAGVTFVADPVRPRTKKGETASAPATPPVAEIVTKDKVAARK